MCSVFFEAHQWVIQFHKNKKPCNNRWSICCNMHPTSKQYEKTLGKVNWLNSSLPKKGVRSCVYELYWLVAMRKCPYWLQWLTRYDKNRQFSKCNENNRKQKHIWTHRGLNFSFLWEEVCATMKGRDNWLFSKTVFFASEADIYAKWTYSRSNLP